VVSLVRKADGWTASFQCDPQGRPRFRPKGWLLDPVDAEATIDQAAIARMGPFLPVDRVAMCGALGADDAPGTAKPEQMVLPLGEVAPAPRVEGTGASDDAT
jgi:hypothetical protein